MNETVKVIQPTVGRVVYFYPADGDLLNRPGYDEPMAAIVTRVWGDRMVNLAVFDPDGNPHARTSVPMVQPGDEFATNTHCRWMPYQIGQAQKHAAAG